MEYNIIGTHETYNEGKPEVIDTACGIVETRKLVYEYQLAFGSQWIIKYEIK